MNNFPIGYQSYYYPQQKQGNARIYVQGETGAKSYLVAPNTTVDLWDSEKPVIYVKSADATGIPTLAVLDYSIRNNAPAEPNFVTHDELDQLKSYIDTKFNEMGGVADDE